MLELAGNITPDGKLTVFNQASLNNWRLKNAGKDVVLSLKIKRPRRSIPQNSYYWACVVPMVTEAINSYGNDFSVEETHEFLKCKFGAKEVEVKDGNCLSIAKSTGNMDTAEFGSYLESIRQFSSMVLGVYIPEPYEQLTIDHYLNQESISNQ